MNHMISRWEIASLLLIGVLGAAMALFWYLAVKNHWKISELTIYDLPIGNQQIKRELKNSIHAPMHAVILAAFLYLGFFQNSSPASFVGSALTTTVWAEVWHY